jgi:hypothetical protein
MKSFSKEKLIKEKGNFSSNKTLTSGTLIDIFTTLTKYHTHPPPEKEFSKSSRTPLPGVSTTVHCKMKNENGK